VTWDPPPDEEPPAPATPRARPRSRAVPMQPEPDYPIPDDDGRLHGGEATLSPIHALTVRQAEVARRMLGDWYIGEGRCTWPEVDLELFPEPRFAAIAKLANQGIEPGRLGEAIVRNGASRFWRHAGDAIEALLQTDSSGRSFEASVRELQELHARREFYKRTAGSLDTLASRSLEDVAKEHREALDVLVGTARAGLSEPIRGAALFEDLGPIDWVCEGLELAPGAPSIWAGYGFTGKTLVAQALAVAVASGYPFCGMPVRHGRVVHLDWEQGKRLTLTRYQKLVAGMHAQPEDLGENLGVHVLPTLRLSDPAAESALRTACSGAALLIVDSFRAACPDIDENSSAVRAPLDVLHRISEQTGCAAVVIHHGRKPSREEGAGDPRFEVRGSSALFDAGSSVFVFRRGEDEERTRIIHQKARITGRTRSELALGIRADVFGGLVVELGEHADEEESEPSRRQQRIDRHHALQAEILSYVSRHPGVSTRAVCAELGIPDGRPARAAFEALEMRGAVIRHQGARGSGARWSATDSAAPAEGDEGPGGSPSTAPERDAASPTLFGLD